MESSARRNDRRLSASSVVWSLSCTVQATSVELHGATNKCSAAVGRQWRSQSQWAGLQLQARTCMKVSMFLSIASSFLACIALHCGAVARVGWGAIAVMVALARLQTVVASPSRKTCSKKMPTKAARTDATLPRRMSHCPATRALSSCSFSVCWVSSSIWTWYWCSLSSRISNLCACRVCGRELVCQPQEGTGTFLSRDAWCRHVLFRNGGCPGDREYTHRPRISEFSFSMSLRYCRSFLSSSAAFGSPLPAAPDRISSSDSAALLSCSPLFYRQAATSNNSNTAEVRGSVSGTTKNGSARHETPTQGMG
eukprot:SAG22_NODE_188_length_15821_cov_38.313319_20_plen_310_part_00